VWRPK